MEKTLGRRTTPGIKEEKRRHDSLATVYTLALWRLRQTWWQLLLIGLAFLTASTLACAPALFSQIADTAGLQELLNGAPARSTFTLNVNTNSLSSATVAATLQKFEDPIRSGMGLYLDTREPALEIDTSNLTIVQPAKFDHLLPLNVYATPLANLQPVLRLVQGRWASERMVNGVVEFMLSESTARALALTPGTLLSIQSNFTTTHSHYPVDARGELTFRLAGIFSDPTDANASALHGRTFQPVEDYLGLHYTLILPSTAFLQACDLIAAREQSAFVAGSAPGNNFHLNWYYHLRTDHIQPGNLDDLTSRLASVQSRVVALPANQSGSFPYMGDAQFLNPSSGNADILTLISQYMSRIAILNLPLSLLTLQTIALLLFFVLLLFSQLIDRQMNMSAHLSSRGASPAQVRWSLIVQSASLCLLAFALGPLLASLLIYKLGLRILPTAELPVLNGVFSSPGHVLVLVAPYLGGTFLVALLTSSLSCWLASGVNILQIRREMTRESRQPFWMRYYLDLLAALLAFSSFGVALYLAQVAHVLDIRTQELVIAPLTLLTPLFLLLGALLLFLRAFPLLLRCAARLSRPARGATSMLALVQMARSPRQATRLIMLLTLAMTFLSFALVFGASQNQRALDVADYESGADFSGEFSGQLVSQMQQKSGRNPGSVQVQQALTERYKELPGVIAASAGYVASGSSTGLGGTQVSLQLEAVDTSTFANVAIWKAQDAAQPLSSLMDILRRSTPANANSLTVPAIVDETTLSNLHLAQGGMFDVSFDTGNMGQSPISFEVVAVVHHIPGINGSTGILDASSSGGLLVDYQTYNEIYLNYQTEQAGLPAQFVQQIMPNYLWLHSADTPAALSSVRAALGSSNLALTNLYDRRAIGADLQNDPLVFSILLLLVLGGITVLLVAFLSSLAASWLNVRLRLSNFIVLRALGAKRWQVMSILLWEQGVVYLVSLVFSLLLGGVLIEIVVPELVFTGLPSHGALSEISANQLYLLQTALPPQIVIPLTLQLAWPALLLACALTLALLARAILRASYGQELRLNAD